jgi:alpha-mannosidase
MMVSLLRSHTLGAYGFGGGYEPGMSSETGLQLGKEITLHYALVPHDGDWREAAIYREGLEFNNPLVCRKITPHAGRLPKRWGLLEISHCNIALTALKPGDDGAIILRINEASGRPVSGVKIKLHAATTSAHECNLIEVSGRELKTADGTIEFDLRAFEIKTFELHLALAKVQEP